MNFSFGTPTTTAAASTFGTTSTPGGFTFGSGDAKPLFGGAATTDSKPFNFTSPSSNAPTVGGFSFGAKTAAPTASASTTNPPAFGASKPLAFGGFASPPNQTVGSPGFGQPATQNAGNVSFGGQQQPPPAFGTPTTQASTGFSFGGSDSKGGLFGSPQQPTATSSQPIQSGFSFGSGNANTQPGFGSPVGQQTQGFGQATSFATPTTQTLSFGPNSTGMKFGQTGQTQPTTGLNFQTTQSQPTGLNFSTPATTQSALSFTPATSGINFGTPTSAINFGTTTSASAPTGLNFGSTTSSQNFGTTSVPNFGTTTSQPNFGTTTTTPSFGTTTSQNFGTTTSASQPTSLNFGTTPTTSQPNFGTTISSAPTGLNFGTTTTTSQPNFGTATTTSQNFGTTTTSNATKSNLNLSTPSYVPTTGLNFNAIPSSQPSGLNFGATTTGGASFGTTSTTAPAISFAPASTAPTSTLQSFFKPPATAAPSTAASSTTPSGITPLGKSTAATTMPTISTAVTTVTAPIQPTPISSLTFAQLEENINKWTLDLEEQEKLFLNQATQINAWDRLLISNGEKILELNETVTNVKNEQQSLEHELDFIQSQQKELEDLLSPMEKQLLEENTDRLRDPEREHMYSLAENLDTQLKQMSEDLKEVIEHLNETNRSQDGNDPIVQIGRILNAHMSSMQWIDNSISQISTKLDHLKVTHDTLRRDNERSFQLTYN